jgi:hypothetical protein
MAADPPRLETVFGRCKKRFPSPAPEWRADEVRSGRERTNPGRHRRAKAAFAPVLAAMPVIVPWHAHCIATLPACRARAGDLMSYLDNPYRHDTQPRCSCGAHATQREHDAAQAQERSAIATDPERLSARVLEQAALRSLFPDA